MIRKAKNDDLNRIAEIEVFNYRLQFYPIFRSDEFYFGELQVPNVANRYADSLGYPDLGRRRFEGIHSREGRRGQETLCGADPAGTWDWCQVAGICGGTHGCKYTLGVGEEHASHPLLSAARLPTHRRETIGGWYQRVSGSDAERKQRLENCAAINNQSSESA